MVHEVKIYLLCVCFVILHLEKKQFEKTHRKCACFFIPNLEKEQKICLFPAYFVIANLEKTI